MNKLEYTEHYKLREILELNEESISLLSNYSGYINLEYKTVSKLKEVLEEEQHELYHANVPELENLWNIYSAESVWNTLTGQDGEAHRIKIFQLLDYWVQHEGNRSAKL